MGENVGNVVRYSFKKCGKSHARLVNVGHALVATIQTDRTASQCRPESSLCKVACLPVSELPFGKQTKQEYVGIRNGALCPPVRHAGDVLRAGPTPVALAQCDLIGSVSRPLFGMVGPLVWP